ncbi:MAG: peptidylprolyl isomerase [Saprospiraceae bacterium]
MIKFWASLCTLWVASLGLLTAQTADMRTLFSVENKPVTVEEFTYIYSKTNGEKADFSKESLQEYLDLYVKFKLKVQRAKDMRLDTIQSLKDELAGYRRQLADSYLIDRAIGDRLLQEAYAHLQEDVDISHILVALKTNPTPADTLAAYQRIMMAKESINKKVTFEMVAKDVSDDKYSKEKGAHWLYTCAFPQWAV